MNDIERRAIRPLWVRGLSNGGVGSESGDGWGDFADGLKSKVRNTQEDELDEEFRKVSGACRTKKSRVRTSRRRNQAMNEASAPYGSCSTRNCRARRWRAGAT